jgi:hypothetical protein
MYLSYFLTVLLFVYTSALDPFQQFAESTTRHTNNWAILVDTSRFWFNYRHVANVLSIYRSVKRLGKNFEISFCKGNICRISEAKERVIFFLSESYVYLEKSMFVISSSLEGNE